MGFETVTGAGSIALSKLAVGEAVTGYLKAISEEMGKFGKQYNLIMQPEDGGTEFKVYPAGTAKYVAQNIAQHIGMAKFDKATPDAVERDAKMLGHLIRITKTGSYVQKATGKEVATFQFDRDPEKKLF